MTIEDIIDAIKEKNYSTALQLLQINKNLLNETVDSATPLLQALYCSPIDRHFVNELLKMGANVNIVDSSVNSPLNYAIHKNEFDIAEKILTHINLNTINITSSKGYHALLGAVLKNNQKLILLLLEKGADYKTTDEEVKESPTVQLFSKYKKIENSNDVTQQENKAELAYKLGQLYQKNNLPNSAARYYKVSADLGNKAGMFHYAKSFSDYNESKNTQKSLELFDKQYFSDNLDYRKKIIQELCNIAFAQKDSTKDTLIDFENTQEIAGKANMLATKADIHMSSNHFILAKSAYIASARLYKMIADDKKFTSQPELYLNESLKLLDLASATSKSWPLTNAMDLFEFKIEELKKDTILEKYIILLLDYFQQEQDDKAVKHLSDQLLLLIQKENFPWKLVFEKLQNPCNEKNLSLLIQINEKIKRDDLQTAFSTILFKYCEEVAKNRNAWSVESLNFLTSHISNNLSKQDNVIEVECKITEDKQVSIKFKSETFSSLYPQVLEKRAELLYAQAQYEKAMLDCKIISELKKDNKETLFLQFSINEKMREFYDAIELSEKVWKSANKGQDLKMIITLIEKLNSWCQTRLSDDPVRKKAQDIITAQLPQSLELLSTLSLSEKETFIHSVKNNMKLITSSSINEKMIEIENNIQMIKTEDLRRKTEENEKKLKKAYNEIIKKAFDAHDEKFLQREAKADRLQAIFYLAKHFSNPKTLHPRRQLCLFANIMLATLSGEKSAEHHNMTTSEIESMHKEAKEFLEKSKTGKDKILAECLLKLCHEQKEFCINPEELILSTLKAQNHKMYEEYKNSLANALGMSKIERHQWKEKVLANTAPYFFQPSVISDDYSQVDE